MGRRSLRRALAGALALGLAVLAWLFLAPASLGGSTSYALIVGSSMEPRLHRGDLVLVRTAGEYPVGAVVAYRDSELRSLVLHRIVRRDGERYVFKGDNNDFVDPVRSEPPELVGELWLRVPQAGNVIGWARSPRNAAILAGFAALLAVGGTGGAKAARRRRNRPLQGAGASPPSLSPLGAHDARTAVAVAAALTLAFAALGALAFTRPTTTVVSRSDLYEHTGSFSYSAAVPPGPAYERGRLITGDPIFLRLVDELSISFAYRLRSDVPHSVRGNTTLKAELAAENGWKREFPLQPLTAFDGERATAGGTLDLARLRSLVREVEEQTGVVTGSYRLTVSPVIEVEGSVAGHGVGDTFAPVVSFRLDSEQLQLEQSTDATGEAIGALRQTEAGSIEVMAPSTLSAARAHFRVTTARKAVVVGGAGSLAVTLLLGLLVLLGRRGDEATRIQGRYGRWLLPVAAAHPGVHATTIDVTTFESLLRVAERYDRLILHEQVDGRHAYLVEDAGVAYRYRVGAGWPEEADPLEPAPAAAPPSAKHANGRNGHRPGIAQPAARESFRERVLGTRRAARTRGPR